MTTASELTLTDLTKSYGKFRALEGVTFTVAPGESVAIVGPNGAGKSTLFGVIGGQLKLDRGNIRYDSTDITKYRADQRIRAGLARTFQVARLFEGMTVVENVVLAYVSAGGRHRRARNAFADIEAISHSLAALDRVHLTGRVDTLIGELAQGERKRLEVAMALVQDASLLMLDEPTAGMGAEETAALIDLVLQLREATDRPALLFASHDMDVVMGLADRIVFMNLGRVLVSGKPADVAGDPQVKALYLGGQK